MDRKTAQVAKPDHVLVLIVRVPTDQATLLVLREAAVKQARKLLNLANVVFGVLRCLPKGIIAKALTNADHVVPNLAENALLNDPVILLMKCILNPIAELEVEFKLVFRQNLVVVNGLKEVGSRFLRVGQTSFEFLIYRLDFCLVH